MKKRRLLIAAALVSVLLLTAIRMTASYLTDVETMNNVITIGKVNITLDEGSFNPKTSVPGRVEVKAPHDSSRKDWTVKRRSCDMHGRSEKRRT